MRLLYSTALPLAVALSVGALAGCANQACRCEGAVPEGVLAASCGDTQCVGGVLYRCTGRNEAILEADTCMPMPPPPPAMNPRPSEYPDFLFVAVSGHCLAGCPEVYNHEYLASDRAGGLTTIDVLAQPMLTRGFTVEFAAFTDNFYDEPGAAGFLSLMARLDRVRDTMIADWDNPTRVIVVAHSHGAMWAHAALHVLEQEGRPIPVDALVDLDSVDWGWADKVIAGFGDAWALTIDAYVDRTGTRWPFDVARPRGALVRGAQIDDVVPSSVIVNVETWSAGYAGLDVRDAEMNVRTDGSRRNVFLYDAREVPENHVQCDDPDSTTVSVVANALREAYGW